MRTIRSNRDLLISLNRNPSRFLKYNELQSKSHRQSQVVGISTRNVNKGLIDTEISSLHDKVNDDLGQVGIDFKGEILRDENYLQPQGESDVILTARTARANPSHLTS